MSEKDNELEFLDFLSEEFDRTTSYATFEEEMEFAFGSVQEAIERYENKHGKKYKKNEEYFDDSNFQGFVWDEFRDMAAYASDVEMAEWAFGSLEEAEEEFGKRQKEQDAD